MARERLKPATEKPKTPPKTIVNNTLVVPELDLMFQDEQDDTSENKQK